MICEAIIITNDKEGNPHLAPLGLIQRDEYWIIAPYRQSTSLANLYCNPRCVANLTDDARVFAGCLTGRTSWSLTPTRFEFPPRLTGALAHWELEVQAVEEDPARPRFVCKVTGRGTHAPFAGYNRAYGAVVEAAVIVSRLHLLPTSEVESELLRLRAIVSKTAGDLEAEAFRWLEVKVSNHKLRS